jgi:hypothetical protein
MTEYLKMNEKKCCDTGDAETQLGQSTAKDLSPNRVRHRIEYTMDGQKSRNGSNLCSIEWVREKDSQLGSNGCEEEELGRRDAWRRLWSKNDALAQQFRCGTLSLDYAKHPTCAKITIKPTESDLNFQRFFIFFLHAGGWIKNLFV